MATTGNNDHSVRRAASAGIVFLALLVNGAANAATLPNGNQAVAYAVVREELSPLLGGIAAQAGLRADVSGKVGGVVNGRLPPGTLRETLDRLGAVYGFEWYCDGTTLHVSAAAEQRSVLLAMGAVDAPTFLHTLDQFGISDERWPVRVSDRGDIALLDGPPALVNLAEKTLAALAARRRDASVSVTVFRG